jgi:hypothetical protein
MKPNAFAPLSTLASAVLTAALTAAFVTTALQPDTTAAAPAPRAAAPLASGSAYPPPQVDPSIPLPEPTPTF